MKSFLFEKREAPIRELNEDQISDISGGYDGEIVTTPGGSTGTMWSTPDERGIHTDD